MAHFTSGEVRGSAGFGAGTVLALFGLVYANEQVNPHGPSLTSNPYWLWGISEAAAITLAGIYGWVAPGLELPMPPEPSESSRPKLRALALIILVLTLGPPIGILLAQTGFIRSIYLPWVVVAILLAILLQSRRSPIRGQQLNAHGHAETPEEAILRLTNERNEARRERDALQTQLTQVPIETIENAAKWDNVAPAVRSYREVAELTTRLKNILGPMQSNMPQVDPSRVTVAQHEASLRTAFTANENLFNGGTIRQDLTRIATTSQATFGVRNEAVNNAMTARIMRPEDLQRVIEGMDDLSAQLSREITRRAAQVYGQI